MSLCPEGYAIREGEGFLSRVRKLTGTVQEWDEIRQGLDWALSRNPTDSSISTEIIGNTRYTELPGPPELFIIYDVDHETCTVTYSNVAIIS